MYDKFTDRAIKVMQMANTEAQRFNHEYIGTEHILLALVAEGTGVAANVLKNLDIDLARIPREVEKIVQAGAEMVTMGKLPQTPRAKKVIEYAFEEARAFQHNFVGTEHLLLGLLRDHDTVAAQVLLTLGLKPAEAREEVCNLLGIPRHLAKIDPALAAASQDEPEPTEVLKPEIQHLPTCARAIIDEFDCQIVAIREEKEQAVAAQNFETAARLRDLECKLADLRKEFIAQWPKQGEP